MGVHVFIDRKMPNDTKCQLLKKQFDTAYFEIKIGASRITYMEQVIALVLSNLQFSFRFIFDNKFSFYVHPCRNYNVNPI